MDLIYWINIYAFQFLLYLSRCIPTKFILRHGSTDNSLFVNIVGFSCTMRCALHRRTRLNQMEFQILSDPFRQPPTDVHVMDFVVFCLISDYEQWRMKFL